MNVLPSQFDMLSRLLDATETRHRAISQNVANVDTPGYQRMDVSFEEALAERLRRSPTADPNSAAIEVTIDTTSPARADGNNVDVDREMGQMNKKRAPVPNLFPGAGEQDGHDEERDYGQVVTDAADRAADNDRLTAATATTAMRSTCRRDGGGSIRMGLGNILSASDISASGMAAERQRMELVANNVANAYSTRTPEGGPYRRRQVVFESALDQATDPLQADGKGLRGVRVVGVEMDSSEFPRVYQPGHPDADDEGFVTMPNVQPAVEMVNLISASRAYEANLRVLRSFRQMAEQALALLRGS